MAAGYLAQYRPAESCGGAAYLSQLAWLCVAFVMQCSGCGLAWLINMPVKINGNNNHY